MDHLEHSILSSLVIYSWFYACGIIGLEPYAVNERGGWLIKVCMYEAHSSTFQALEPLLCLLSIVDLSAPLRTSVGYIGRPTLIEFLNSLRSSYALYQHL